MDTDTPNLDGDGLSGGPSFEADLSGSVGGCATCGAPGECWNPGPDCPTAKMRARVAGVVTAADASRETLATYERIEEPAQGGVWVSYDDQRNELDNVTIWGTEVEALRAAMSIRGQAKFVRYGEQI
jgi:hypothetical protein